jgi:hypothetical protein
MIALFQDIDDDICDGSAMTEKQGTHQVAISSDGLLFKSSDRAKS